MSNHEPKEGLDRLRELIVIAQARAGWSEEWNVELNVLACKVVPDLLDELDRLRDALRYIEDMGEWSGAAAYAKCANGRAGQ